jgi:hypothetical protein
MVRMLRGREHVVGDLRDLLRCAPCFFEQVQRAFHGAPFRVLVQRHFERQPCRCGDVGDIAHVAPGRLGRPFPPHTGGPAREVFRRADRVEQLDRVVHTHAGSTSPIDARQVLAQQR